jgi:hypothetical protein
MIIIGFGCESKGNGSIKKYEEKYTGNLYRMQHLNKKVIQFHCFGTQNI